MSMLVITGMEMPQICFMCRFCRKLWTEEGNFLSAECILTNDTLDQDDVNWFPYSCPLCEVPDWIPVWIPVKKRLPDSGVHVLVSCKSNGGCRYVCDAFYSAPPACRILPDRGRRTGRAALSALARQNGGCRSCTGAKRPLGGFQRESHQLPEVFPGACSAGAEALLRYRTQLLRCHPLSHRIYNRCRPRG